MSTSTPNPYDPPTAGGSSAVPGPPDVNAGYTPPGNNVPYNPAGYSTPGPGGLDHAPVRNGLGLAALVVGIIAFLSGFLFPVAIVLGIGAIILGVLGRKRAKQGQATNKGMATAGIVLGTIALLFGILVAALTGFVTDRFGECTNLTGVEQQQCVEENLGGL